MRKLSRYELLGRLAAGEMTELWLARIQPFKRVVALKTLHRARGNPGIASTLLNSVRRPGHLNHSNCVHVFEAAWSGEVAFLVTAYVNGFSLSRVLKRAQESGGIVPVAVVARIVSDALLGLHHAHQLTDASGQNWGLIHGGISPDNLIISFDGVPKLTDFLIAHAAVLTNAQTPSGKSGKFGQLAPEGLVGPNLDLRADVFALGVLLYRMLTGRWPFRGPDEAAVSNAVLVLAPPEPSTLSPEVPTALSKVVMRAIEKNPNARFSSAAQMRTALEAAVTPASTQSLGAFMARLWPQSHPQRRALDALAAGLTEGLNDPLLEPCVDCAIGSFA